MMRVWRGGELVAPEEAQIPIADRGFLLGDGVFETIAVRGGAPFDVEAHLDRLASGLAILGFSSAVDLEKLKADIADYLAAEQAFEAVLRVTVTRGVGPRGLVPPTTGLKPSIVMTLSPMPPAREQPLSLHLATATRRNEFSPVSRIKALPYLDNLIALREALANGAKEALMLNTCGAIACASVANLFIIRNGRLETPPITDGALPGTTRKNLLALAKMAGLAAAETSLFANDVAEADHVLLTNSIGGLMEASRLDGQPLQRRADVAVNLLRKLVRSPIPDA